ncbi:MAG TPA: hypothetical protein PLS49_06120, partial [Candidatus Woesebacteria bacterium]|nr:hypothetical protein [Candidatus Woesebacteria bacterium]
MNIENPQQNDLLINGPQGRDWVHIPLGDRYPKEILLQLPTDETLTDHFKEKKDGTGYYLTEVGKELVNPNWLGFRNCGGMGTPWEKIKQNPEYVRQRVNGLNEISVTVFKRLGEHFADNKNGQIFLDLMRTAFESKITSMETTALNAELETDNSPWAGQVGLFTDRLFGDTEQSPNLRRGTGLSHIQATRRKIAQEVTVLVASDNRLNPEDEGLFRTWVENRFVETAKAELEHNLPGNTRGLGIRSLEDAVRRNISTQPGVKADMADFYLNCVEEYHQAITDERASQVTAREIRKTQKRRVLGLRTIGFLAGVSAVVATHLTPLLSKDGTNTSKTYITLAIEQSDPIAEVTTDANEQEILPAEIPPLSPTAMADTQGQPQWLSSDINGSGPAYPETEPVPQGFDLDTTLAKEKVGEVVDETDPIETETEWYEIAGIDFSKPVTITLSPELSQAVGAGSESLVINIENHTYDGLTGLEDDLDDPDFTGDEAKNRGLVVFGNYSDNIFWKGHSYTEEVWKSSNLKDWSFEFLRRIAEIKQKNGGELPDNLKDVYIELSQGNIIRTARLLNVTVLPEESFAIGVYDDDMPARYMIGEGDRVIDFGDLNEDLNEPGIVHMVTCINPMYDGLGRTKGFKDRVVASLVLEEKPSLPPSSDLIASNTDAQPNFASIGAENITVQDLRQIPEISEKATSPESISVLQNIFTNYQPAAEALRQSDTPEDIVAFVGNIPVASGS